jgi:1,4-alpha-glucan branching enzyme
MVTEQRIDKGDTCVRQVTFSMPAINDCNCLYLVGKFDEWGESVYRMQRTQNGGWSLTLELEPNFEYEYRYRTDKGLWYADPIGNKPVQLPRLPRDKTVRDHFFSKSERR